MAKAKKQKYIDKLPDMVKMALPKSLFKNAAMKKKFVNAFVKELELLKSNPANYATPGKTVDATITILKNVFTKHEDIARQFGRKNVIEMLNNFREMFGITEETDDDWVNDLPDDEDTDEIPEENGEAAEAPEETEEPAEDEMPEEPIENGEEEAEASPGEIHIEDFDPMNDEDMDKFADLMIKALGLDTYVEGEEKEKAVSHASDMLKKVRDAISRKMEGEYAEFEEQLEALRKQNAFLLNENAFLSSKLKNLRTVIKEDVEIILKANMPTILKIAEQKIVESTKYNRYFKLLRSLTEMISVDAIRLADENVKLIESLNEYKEKYAAALELIKAFNETLEDMGDESDTDAELEDINVDNTDNEISTPDELADAEFDVNESAELSAKRAALIRIAEELQRNGVTDPQILENELRKASKLYDVAKVLHTTANVSDEKELTNLTETVYEYGISRYGSIGKDKLEDITIEAIVLNRLVAEGKISADMSESDIYEAIDARVKELNGNSEQVWTD